MKGTKEIISPSIIVSYFLRKNKITEHANHTSGKILSTEELTLGRDPSTETIALLRD